MSSSEVEMSDEPSQEPMTQLSSFQNLSIVGTIGNDAGSILTPEATTSVISMLNNGSGPRLSKEERTAISRIAVDTDTAESLVFASATQGNTTPGHVLALTGILKNYNEIQETWEDLQDTKENLQETKEELKDVSSGLKDYAGSNRVLERKLLWNEQRTKKYRDSILAVLSEAFPDLGPKLAARFDDDDRAMQATVDDYFKKRADRFAEYRAARKE